MSEKVKAFESAINICESVRMDAVVSKFATSEECKAYRDGAKKCADLIRRISLWKQHERAP